MNASFVNLGSEKDGFIHYLDLGPQIKSLKKFTTRSVNEKLNTASLKTLREKTIEKEGKINDAVKPGDYILCQVSKEAISTKGPRITTEISLAGRYMVLLHFLKKYLYLKKYRVKLKKID